MMTVKVLVSGAFGRMGQLVTKAIEADEELELVGQTGREYDLKQAIVDSGAKVVVDFTDPAAVYENTLIIIEAGASPVIGTSGLKDEQFAKLQEMCAQLKRGGIVVPNFSIGAVLMMKCAREIAAYFSSVEIIEMHHANKVDSPSGTALRTAQLIASKRSMITAENQKNKTVENVKGARGAEYEGIPIHSLRLPGLLANQTVIFGGVGETLSIRHESIQRESFMPGVCHACKKVMGLTHLALGLEEIL